MKKSDSVMVLGTRWKNEQSEHVDTLSIIHSNVAVILILDSCKEESWKMVIRFFKSNLKQTMNSSLDVKKHWNENTVVMRETTRLGHKSLGWLGVLMN